MEEKRHSARAVIWDAGICKLANGVIDRRGPPLQRQAFPWKGETPYARHAIQILVTFVKTH